MPHEVIIAGASFAGLAVASQIPGRAVLIDRLRVGKGVTSGCVTLRPVVEECGAAAAILQEYTEVMVHLRDHQLVFPLDPPFVAFDYETLCRTMLERTGCEVVTATVKGTDGERVITDKGTFSAPLQVDCTGWKAALGSSFRASLADKRRISFGYETMASYKDARMHMFFDPARYGRGYAWIFPCGDRARFGLGTYRSGTKIDRAFEGLLANHGVDRDSLHGGFFPHKLRRPVAGPIWLAGDSAGMCFPTTGEGIRQAIFFGGVCGRTIGRILDGEITADQGRVEYETAVAQRARVYRMLFDLQRFLMWMPDGVAAAIAMHFNRRFDPFMNWYLGATDHQARTVKSQ